MDIRSQMNKEDEPIETIYLDEKGIEEFLEKYKRENPDAEFETRYVKHPVKQVEQEVSVRYLRPKTPEIGPIIIKEEAPIRPQEAPPIRIVQLHNETRQPQPLVIREHPPTPPNLSKEPQIIYVKKQTKE